MPDIARCFAPDYFEARRLFTEAAAAAGARLESLVCPAKGPGGEQLTTDIAWTGPEDAERVLVTLSATHGVEGFCGSGVQVGWFEQGLARELPARVPGGVALCQVHAINPYGFAWLRRVTEDNVDLNRNFIDHSKPYPANPGYEAIQAALCPPEWNDAVIAETQKLLDAYGAAHGAWALQEAISAGQYSHPQGLFFGGQAPSWSARTLRDIFARRLAKVRHVAVIDYHTGLGPRGHGERISVHPPGSEALDRARAWYDDDLTSPALGDSASVEIRGANTLGMVAAAPRAALTIVALEYGTLPSSEVRLALRAENWLQVHASPSSPRWPGIKAEMREAFYQDADDWKELVWERALETQRLALRGLAESVED